MADEQLSSSQRLVAIVMSEHARDRDRASVTYPRLMRATKLSRDTVARCLAALEASGWLEPVGPVVARRSPIYLLRWSDNRTTELEPKSDERTTQTKSKSDDLTTVEGSWSDDADRRSDSADRWSDDRTPSHLSSQPSSHVDGVRADTAGTSARATAAVAKVSRATSLPRDREVEDVVEWLVREFAFAAEDAWTFVDRHVPPKIDRPLAWLRRWDPADIERKRRRASSRPVSRGATRVCEHGRPWSAGHEVGDVCCEEALRPSTRPGVAL